MPIVYSVPAPTISPPPVVDRADPNGEDVSLRGGELTVTSGGDWAVLNGGPVARQSVEREAVASPGDFPRRPDWGMGLRDSLMRGASQDVRDRQASSIRRRLKANPRIDNVKDVRVDQRGDLAPGAVTVTISANVNGQPVSLVSTVQPKKGI